ncbi:MAG TPA: hypothetical protein VK348_00145, partial [Planctomycetota bacterium]|nr:hypothetical protein [Planctomycetota bacterium]
ECRLENPSLTLVENASPARRVFHLRGRLSGAPLVFESYLYVYAQQDVVRIECTITHCDPNSPAMSYDLQWLWLETGEYFCADYRTRLGLLQPVQQLLLPFHPSYGKWLQLLSGPRTLGRMEQLSFSGWTLCAPVHGHVPQPLAYAAGGMRVDWSVADRVDEMAASFQQTPILGVWLHWDGKWLACGPVPELPAGAVADGGWSDANASWGALSQLLQQPGDLYSQRPRGLNRHAANTGAQEDFGASKGSFAVTVGDPRFLHELGYSAAEYFLRPFHYREADGSRLLAVNHPGYQTWSQLPNCRTTFETLGMACPLPYSWPNDGWDAFDDQHRSNNNLNALLALTGSYALRDQLQDLCEVDQTQVPNRIDSPRAEGRLALSWANQLLLLDAPQDRANLYAHMGQRINTTYVLWPGAAFSDPGHPIRVLGIGRDPTFLDSNGVEIPAVVTWEHAIAVAGYYAAYRVTGDQRYHDMAAELARLIVNYCIYPENGHWVCCTCIRYRTGADEGLPLPASSYYAGSPDIHIGINFYSWVLPAVLVARELHRGIPYYDQRCAAILQDWAPNGPPDWQASEWWAVLPR